MNPIMTSERFSKSITANTARELAKELRVGAGKAESHGIIAERVKRAANMLEEIANILEQTREEAYMIMEMLAEANEQLKGKKL